jgi:processive 1,2-diacylglycerol beta-glucosyltransferase
MSGRVLILTAGFGEGHNAAARALAAACDAQHGPGTARVVDVFALAAPRLNAIARSTYIGIITRAPGLWNAVYRWLDRSPSAGRLLRMLALERRKLLEILRTESPAILCSTYPVYGFLLSELEREGHRIPPHYSVVTDSISINSLWWRAGAAGWILPNADSADVMIAAGVPAAKLHVLGFPVAPLFADPPAGLTPGDLSTGSPPRVLCVVNSGTPVAAQIARRLLTDTDWEVTCTVGRNAKLESELMRLALNRRPPTRVLGWTDQIPRLLFTHHVVISKAGGATTQEALAARCPMIVNQIVPGQEEGNCELLRRHGIGALAETPSDVLATLRQAFADNGAVWRRWRRGTLALHRPRAAAEIAAFLLAEAGLPAASRSPARAAVVENFVSAAVSPAEVRG